MNVRVLLADDHPIFIDGLEASLSVQPSIEVVGTAANSTDALQQIRQHQPDVVLMDISMPGMNGIEATRRVRNSYPDCRVILLTTHLNNEYIAGGLGAGAAGYLLKNGPIEHVVQAIHSVAEGGSVLHPTVAAKVISEFNRLQAERPAQIEQHQQNTLLSERELDVLRLVAQGYSNRVIADRLVITEATVKRHVSNILGKLHVADREGAAELARVRGLV